MPKALLSSAEWAEVHATAVALGSIRKAAQAHGISEAAVYKRARRGGWLVGHPATVKENRERRVTMAKAAGVETSTPAQDAHRPAADTIDEAIRQTGRKTRAMLSQALCRAAGQARKTVHPLAKARHIRDVASAAATVHPDQFGERAGMGTVNGDAQQRLQIALVQVFGDVKGFTLGGDEQPARLPAGGELAENPALPTSTPALPEV